RQRVRFGHFGAERVAIDRGGGGNVGYDDRDVVQPADHRDYSRTSGISINGRLPNSSFEQRRNTRRTTSRTASSLRRACPGKPSSASSTASRIRAAGEAFASARPISVIWGGATARPRPSSTMLAT